ncbi:TadE/TadG family type IV pilus assembly protein [Roseomonas rosulenta]|uniref:TadE/TadG family type IV pilus assembly protein n=1 Tax=Roseomonas rosulenta TaxID=2748667 RepID=UPI0018DF3E9A|nr:TadE/TadG family type IV pilus assembly protein [Roseomonas rosulenta]
MSNFASASRRVLRERRGIAAAEFALVGGIFFVMMLAGIDIGRYYMAAQGLRNFMGDAVRYGVVNMSAGQSISCRDLVAATGRGGAVGGMVASSTGTAGGGTAGTCVRRTETAAGGTTTVTVTAEIDTNFTFVMNVFGILTPRMRDTTTVTYQL